MNRADVLWRQVIEDPRDDAARLAWADAVGGPRGELVKVQLGLKGVGPGPADANKQRSLLSAHSQDWAAEIRPLVRDLSFHRGFVEWVVVEAPRFAEVAEERSPGSLRPAPSSRPSGTSDARGRAATAARPCAAQSFASSSPSSAGPFTRSIVQKTGRIGGVKRSPRRSFLSTDASAA